MSECGALQKGASIIEVCSFGVYRDLALEGTLGG